MTATNQTQWTCLIRIKAATGGHRSHLIEKSTFTLGRTQDSDVPLLSSSISRIHLILEVKDGEVWATDKNSANGTLKNNQLMVQGAPTMISPHDVLKLGTENDEFQFLAIPVPVELQNREERAGSIKDSMKELAKQFEAQSKERVEKELRQARSESEQIIAEAKKRAEIQRTQDGIEIQARRQSVEDELARLRHTTMEDVGRERLKAKREADMMIADAQRTIQKDFEEAGKKIEIQMSDAHARSLSILQQAELNSQTFHNEAQVEAHRIRTAAAEEARAIHKDAVKKSEEFLAEAQATYTREYAEQKAQILEAARIEARNESDRTIAGLAQAREDFEQAKAKLESLKAELIEAKTQLREKNEAKDKVQNDVDALRRENEKLLTELKRVEELESRGRKAQSELDQLLKSKLDQEALVEREIREHREKKFLDLENFKRDQDADMAKARIKALDDIKKLIRDEEKRYEDTKRLRAIDIAQSINAKLVPQISTWLKDGETAPTAVKIAVEQATLECILNAGTALSSVSVLDDAPKASAEKKQALSFKYAAIAVGILAVLAFVFRERIQKFAARSQQASYSSKVMEERKQRAKYVPDQTDEFRDTYVQNVLRMKHYYEVKTDQATIDAWTLKLNDLSVIKPMKLTEEDIIQFMSKETNLVLRLGVLRDSIDAVYLDEGLERMKKAEAEGVAEILKVIKTEENYRKIRSLEEAFIKERIEKKGAIARY